MYSKYLGKLSCNFIEAKMYSDHFIFEVVIIPEEYIVSTTKCFWTTK